MYDRDSNFIDNWVNFIIRCVFKTYVICRFRTMMPFTYFSNKFPVIKHLTTKIFYGDRLWKQQINSIQIQSREVATFVRRLESMNTCNTVLAIVLHYFIIIIIIYLFLNNSWGIHLTYIGNICAKNFITYVYKRVDFNRQVDWVDRQVYWRFSFLHYVNSYFYDD